MSTDIVDLDGVCWNVFEDHVSGAGVGRSIYQMVRGHIDGAEGLMVFPASMTVDQLDKWLRRHTRCGDCRAAGGVVHEADWRATFVVQHAPSCSWASVMKRSRR